VSSPLLKPPSEGCDNSNGEITEVRLNAAALTNPDSLHTKISFPSVPFVSSSGLVDSGSSHCFVDPGFVAEHSFSTYEIPPVVLRLLDGSVGAMITRAAVINIRFDSKDILQVKCYVTKLDSSSAFVFGYDWLHRYNPSIDWSAGQILFFRNPPLLVPSSVSPGVEDSSELPAADTPSASIPFVSDDSVSPSAPFFLRFLLLMPPRTRGWLALRATLFSPLLFLIPLLSLVVPLTLNRSTCRAFRRIITNSLTSSASHKPAPFRLTDLTISK